MAQRLKAAELCERVRNDDSRACAGVAPALEDPASHFVNSTSDLFHEDVPLEFIQRTFAVMRQALWHTFQVLMKRAERLGGRAWNAMPAYRQDACGLLPKLRELRRRKYRELVMGRAALPTPVERPRATKGRKWTIGRSERSPYRPSSATTS